MVSKGRRAGIYVRISQDREGLEAGVTRQEEDCRALAKRNGWEIVEVYSDNDLSAYSKKPRPAWKKLLKDIEAGKVNAVLAYSSSRLYRHTRDLLPLLDLAQSKGTEISTVASGEIDFSTADGRMVAKIKADVDQAEAERNSERTVRAKKQNRIDGKWLGGGRRPYGYRLVRQEGQPNRQEIDEVEAKAIRDIAHRIIGGDGLNRVTVELNERGTETSGGNRWRPAHVKRLLLRDLPPAFPPILKDDERRILKARLANMATKKGRPTGARRYVLTGLVFCSSCGTKMVGSGGKSGEKSGGKWYELYRCDVQSGGCGKVSIGALRLEEHLLEQLDHNVAIPVQVEDNPPGQDNGVTLAEMAQIEERLKTLASDLGLSERQLAARSRALERKLADLEKRLSNPKAKPTDVREARRLLVGKFVRWMERRLTPGEVLEMNDLIAEIVRGIHVLPGRRVDLADRVRIEWVS
jgi:site-specific DNA recombinase